MSAARIRPRRGFWIALGTIVFAFGGCMMQMYICDQAKRGPAHRAQELHDRKMAERSAALVPAESSDEAEVPIEASRSNRDVRP